MLTPELSQIEKALFFPALNSDVLPVITGTALAIIAANPGLSGQALRGAVHDAYVADFITVTNTMDGWGEATAVCLQQVVIDAFLAAHKTNNINTAFIEDQQMFADSIASGAVIDNPWVLDLDGDGAADAGRAEALDLRIWVLAVSHGGDAGDTWNLADVPVVAVGFMQDVQGL